MASSSGQDKERERKAQEADFNRVGQSTPAKARKETQEKHPGNISSDSSTVIMKGRARDVEPKK
jgi:hypothetical protein